MEPLNFGNGEREPKEPPRSMPRYRKRNIIMITVICSIVINILVAVGVANIVSTSISRANRAHYARVDAIEVARESELTSIRISSARESTNAFVEAVPVIVNSDDSIPLLTVGENGHFEYHIPFIAAGDIVRVGRVDPTQGVVYQATVSAGRGHGVFIGLTNSPNVTSLSGTPWGPAASASNNPNVSIIFSDSSNKYLYVGSSDTWASPRTVDLHDVKIVITVEEQLGNWLNELEAWAEYWENWAEEWTGWAEEWSENWGSNWSNNWSFNWNNNRNNNWNNNWNNNFNSAPCTEASSSASTCNNAGAEPPIDLNRLAPFMSPEALSETAMDLFNNGYAIDINRLAPFMLQADVNVVVLTMINNGAVVDLRRVAPFMLQSGVDEAALRQVENGVIIELERLAPFMSQTAVSEVALVLLNNGVNLDVHRLAPFLTREMVDELVRRIVN